MMPKNRCEIFLIMPAFILMAFISVIFAFTAKQVSATELSFPYYASLRSDEVNVRTGPGFRYPIEWVYRRAGLPVRIIDRYEQWRKVEDYEGDGGWVHRNLLANQRTVLLLERTEMKARPDEDSRTIAFLEGNVIALLDYCVGDWCQISIRQLNGWARRDILWGQDP